jgi:hypothetical protein
VNGVEDFFPVGVLKTGEAERLVEAAIVGDGEIGTEDDADAASDLADAPRGNIGPGAVEKAKTAVVGGRGKAGREKENECGENGDVA